mgnify:CR=1 FL=1
MPQPPGCGKTISEVIILKKTVLKILSYVLVAVIASGTTVACFLFAQRDRSTKLREVENLLQQYFIGDVDTNKLEDAAASAMVSALTTVSHSPVNTIMLNTASATFLNFINTPSFNIIQSITKSGHYYN